MKKLHFIPVLTLNLLLLTACSDNSNGSASATDSLLKKSDSSAALTPASGNSSATNPSLADTAYSANDSTKMKKDSTKR